MTALTGRSRINGRPCTEGGAVFRARNPATGAELSPEFFSVTPHGVDEACASAGAAAAELGGSSGRQRGTMLRAVAASLDHLGGEIVLRAGEETGLPAARLRGELRRTCGQLLLFAELAEEGSWVDARIDHGDPGREPAPRPDVRSMLRPRGPVAVFGAGNFPLAFSTAGGDTAAALAAGCPVVVKAHPDHPGTSELAAHAVEEGIRRAGLPPGSFALLFDAGFGAGLALAGHPAITAVGFTGSRAGGEALARIAAARPVPIPVYAEMGSVNPVVILPGALEERGEAIAAGVVASVTLGVGQFCTNPGLVFVPRGPGSDRFFEALDRRMAAGGGGVMLTRRHADAYRAGLARRAGEEGVILRRPAGAGDDAGTSVQPAYATVEADGRTPPGLLAEEIFGPCTTLVRYDSVAALPGLLGSLPGQLTCTIHAAPADEGVAGVILAAAERLAGRVIMNGFPTGVEVCHAMVHGGPFPATLDGGSTSVGTLAIRRFTRQVAFQDVPEVLLPRELRESNPLRIMRLVDGGLTMK